MTLSHSLLCNHPSLFYPTDLLYPLPDASDLPHSEHMYSYISENNFGPSNQIIVLTGYIVKGTLKFMKLSQCVWIHAHVSYT
jgi:hypothetical protein